MRQLGSKEYGVHLMGKMVVVMSQLGNKHLVRKSVVVMAGELGL